MSKSGSTSARVLYLSYNGLLDPLGQSQVLQYLLGLASRGHRITLMTFEKPDEWSREDHRRATEEMINAARIRWVPLMYHHRPRWPATIYDLVAAFVVAVYLVLRHRVQIVHVRGYQLGPVAAVLGWIPGVRFIFDQRSLWPDELAEVGVWKEGSIGHRIAKALERWFITSADAVVCLTESAKSTVRGYPYMQGRIQRFRVITTCTNLELFRPATREREGDQPFTLGYLGTVGIPYLLDDVFVALTQMRALDATARLLVVNRRDHQYIGERSRACNVPEDAIEVTAANHQNVAQQLWRMDAGVVFITPTVCRRSCAPTKVGELLATGVPCIANAGVGDLERILGEEGVGVIVPDLSVESLQVGLVALRRLAKEPGIRERCVEVAKKYFSLADGVRSYDDLYREVLGQT
jgi:glycosyltransferase involved in cell wall biosynthesis